MRVVQFTDSSGAWPLYGYIHHTKSINCDVGFVPKKTCHQKMHNHYFIRQSNWCPRNETHCNPSQLSETVIFSKMDSIFARNISVSAPACSAHHIPHTFVRCWNEDMYLYMKPCSPWLSSSHFSRCFVISPLI